MTLPRSTREGRCQFHAWVAESETPGWEQCARCGNRRRARSPAPAKKPIKKGRGFAASKAQQEKVRGMACACCGLMADESLYTVIDPAHLCARGMGGCDHEDCVVPLCRGCHEAFDQGQLELAKFLEPTYRREVAHCVTHLGLEGTRIRLAPSQYRRSTPDGKAA